MWRIRIYENSHYQDEDEAYDLEDVFETLEAALARAKRIVDASLAACAAEHPERAALLSCYRMWGDDPVISGPHPSGFSAWSYAEARSAAFATASPT